MAATACGGNHRDVDDEMVKDGTVSESEASWGRETDRARG